MLSRYSGRKSEAVEDILEAAGAAFQGVYIGRDCPPARRVACELNQLVVHPELADVTGKYGLKRDMQNDEIITESLQ